MVRDMSEVQENRGWSAEIMVRSEKSKIFLKMTVYIKLATTTRFYLVFGLKMIILEKNKYK